MRSSKGSSPRLPLPDATGTKSKLGTNCSKRTRSSRAGASPSLASSGRAWSRVEAGLSTSPSESSGAGALAGEA